MVWAVHLHLEASRWSQEALSDLALVWVAISGRLSTTICAASLSGPFGT